MITRGRLESQVAETGLGTCSPAIPESHGPGKSEGPWLGRQGRARMRYCGIQTCVLRSLRGALWPETSDEKRMSASFKSLG